MALVCNEHCGILCHDETNDHFSTRAQTTIISPFEMGWTWCSACHCNLPFTFSFQLAHTHAERENLSLTHPNNICYEVFMAPFQIVPFDFIATCCVLQATFSMSWTRCESLFVCLLWHKYLQPTDRRRRCCCRWRQRRKERNFARFDACLLWKMNAFYQASVSTFASQPIIYNVVVVFFVPLHFSSPT